VKRLTFSLILVVIASVISLGWVIDQWYNQHADTEEDPAITAYKKMGKELANLLDQNSLSTEAIANTWQLGDYNSFPLPEDVETKFKQGEVLLLDSGEVLSLHIYLPNKNAVLSFNLPDDLHQEPADGLRWLLTFLFYFGVILVVLVWLYPLLKRLSRLQTITQNFGNGNLQARIDSDANSYIHSIEQEFNRMAQRIEQLITDNKLLSRSLSHDLRTPLARLRFGIDVLQENSQTDNAQHLAHINRDLIAMEALVEAMLDYSKLDNAELTLKWQNLDLIEAVSNLIQHTQDSRIQLQTENSSIIIQADHFHLLRMIQNLIDNAIIHANQKIFIGIHQDKHQVLLSIEDDGQGINPDETEKVLQPFYRSPNNTKKSGYGLGLAIVNRIVSWHKGNIQIGKSNILGGAKILVSFESSRNH
jgi:signal transduction histidine kinase